MYIDGNYKGRVASVGNEASCRHVRQTAVTWWQVAITCRRGTRVARSLKLLALAHPFLESIEYNIILSTNRSYVISPCETNNMTRTDVFDQKDFCHLPCCYLGRNSHVTLTHNPDPTAQRLHLSDISLLPFVIKNATVSTVSVNITAKSVPTKPAGLQCRPSIQLYSKASLPSWRTGNYPCRSSDTL